MKITGADLFWIYIVGWLIAAVIISYFYEPKKNDEKTAIAALGLIWPVLVIVWSLAVISKLPAYIAKKIKNCVRQIHIGRSLKD